MFGDHDTAGLDAASKDYLKKILSVPPSELPGVRRCHRTLGWWALPMAGAALSLWLAGWELALGAVAWNPWQAGGLAVAGLFLSFISIIRLKRVRGGDALGRFEFLDGAYFWKVTPHRCSVVDLAGMTQVRNKTYRTNGIPTRKTVVALTASGRPLLEAHIAFGPFLAAALSVRTRFCPAGPGLPPPPGVSPAVVEFCADAGGRAQAARQVMDGLRSLRLERSKVIPIPTPRWPIRPAWQANWAGQCAAMALAALVFGAMGLPPLRGFLNELTFYHAAVNSAPDDNAPVRTYLSDFPAGRHHGEVADLLEGRLYLAAQNSPPTSLAEIEDYLASCPNGSHLAEVHALRDDHQFKTDRAEAAQLRSPAPLRNYLDGTVTPDNSRHRAEAADAIDGFYEDAEQHLQDMAGQLPGDKPLLNGLLAALDYLKTNATPDAAISFLSHCDVAPAAASPAYDAEARSAQAYAAKDAVILNLLDKGTNLVIQPQNAFSEDQMERREKNIVRRFREAIGQILSADVITLTQTNDYEHAQIQVAYAIRPAGQLRKYVRTLRPSGQASQAGDPPPITLGLLRDYEIDWQVRFNLPGNLENYEFTLISSPGSSLNMTSGFDDPDWAPYAVTMYSAFYDFAGKLVADAGLAAPAPPSVFTFQDTRMDFRN